MDDFLQGTSCGSASQVRNDPVTMFQKSGKLVTALLESASQAIVGIDRAGRIVLANRRAEEIFGYTREELVGARIEMLLPDSKRAAHTRDRDEYFARPRARPMGIGMDLAGRRKDGSEVPVEVSLSYVEIDAGVFAIAFVSDISPRKRLEEQLLHAQKMEAVGRLAGGVAHDFNNMLTVIAGYNRMILDELSTLDPLRGYAEEILKAADRAVNWLRWHKSGVATTGRNEWTRKRKWLAAEMRRAPKPLAVFAANDQQALDVLESCDSVGIQVPEQVAIIGAENYLPAPEAMHTPISSVDTNLEMLGYRGARLLNDLMNGEPAPEQPVRVPAAGIVARKSSDILTITHRGVARSLRHIWEHSHEPICVKDLVSVAGMSRRGLHMAFWEHLGRTPGQELQRVRIDRAKQLLGGSDNKIETIASQCGYQSANSFCIAFKRVTGMSAKQFREQTPAFGLGHAVRH